jgi:hypothetical protein
VLCCLALVFGAVYPFTTVNPHSENPGTERFSVPDADEYRATGSIVVDGETALEFEGAATDGGGRYQFIDEGDIQTEQYQASPGDPVYERLVVEADGRTDRRRDQIQSDADRELIRESRTDGTVAFISKRESRDLADAISGTASVIIRSLYLTGYQRKADQPQEADVYEPQNGWYEGTETYRVTGATGEVRTVSGSTAVRSVSVSWEQTMPAGTYAESVLVRLTTDAPHTYRFSFNFDSGETTVNRPAWATGANESVAGQGQ